MQNVIDKLERRLKDIHDIDNTTWLDMATNLNRRLYRAMKGKDPERVRSTSIYVVSSSPSTQALPAGFRDIADVGTGFFYRDNAGEDTNRRLDMTGFGSTLPGYYFDGTNVVFTGINTSTTFVLIYTATTADLTAVSSAFVVPDEYLELVIEGMMVEYYKYEEDPREADADLRFSRLWYEFLDTVKKSPNVFVPTVPLNYGS